MVFNLLAEMLYPFNNLLIHRVDKDDHYEKNCESTGYVEIKHKTNGFEILNANIAPNRLFSNHIEVRLVEAHVVASEGNQFLKSGFSKVSGHGFDIHPVFL